MKLIQIKSAPVAKLSEDTLNEELLTEGYEERVQATVQHLVKHFKDQHPTKAQVLAALHTYAAAKHGSAKANAEAEHHLASHKSPATIANGIPDYNGPTATRNTFIKDVLAGLTDKLKFSRVTSTGAVKAPRKLKDDKYYRHILNTVEGSVGNVFPDGDPIDRLHAWMERNNVRMDDINRAFRKFEGKSYDAYIADMWDDHADDALHDAEMDLEDGKDISKERSPFWKLEDGVPKLNENPWVAHGEHAKRQVKREKMHAKSAKKWAKQAADDTTADEVKEGFDFEAWKNRSTLLECGTHPKHPEATYDKELSDKNVAGFSDEHGEQYHIKRKDLPTDHPNRVQKDNE
jgi:hypothetical protein